MGEVNSGFTPENIADAEWLWSNINADHRRFHNLPTHHKAMICHTAQRFRADRITELEAVIAGLVDLLAKATADIAAALIIADKQDVVAAWCEKYVDAINKHDAEAAAVAKAKESRDV